MSEKLRMSKINVIFDTIVHLIYASVAKNYYKQQG